MVEACASLGTLETTSRVAIAGGVTAAKSPAPLKERAALLTLRPGREVIVPILGHFTTQPRGKHTGAAYLQLERNLKVVVQATH